MSERTDYDLGPIRPRPRGEWVKGVEYRYLDIVYYDGGSYICSDINTLDGSSICVNIPPTDPINGSSFWQCLAVKGDKGESPDVYLPYVEVTNGIWDYGTTDKIIIPDDASTDTINIVNVYNGCCGIIITRKELILPSNSYKSTDFNFINIVTAEDRYFYTFTYLDTGSLGNFIWHRSVVRKS